MTRNSRSNFYYAFLFMPKARRRAIYNVYAYCRLIDDIVDGAESVANKERALRDWRRDGRSALLATVVSTWGSSPRPVGSQLAIRDDGRLIGSVSGGCIEDDLIYRYSQAYAGKGHEARMPEGPPSTTHSPDATEKETLATTGRTSPPRRCMVKLLATSETISGVGMMVSFRDVRQTWRIEETRSWV